MVLKLGNKAIQEAEKVQRLKDIVEVLAKPPPPRAYFHIPALIPLCAHGSLACLTGDARS